MWRGSKNKIVTKNVRGNFPIFRPHFVWIPAQKSKIYLFVQPLLFLLFYKKVLGKYSAKILVTKNALRVSLLSAFFFITKNHIIAFQIDRGESNDGIFAFLTVGFGTCKRCSAAVTSPNGRHLPNFARLCRNTLFFAMFCRTVCWGYFYLGVRVRSHPLDCE